MLFFSHLNLTKQKLRTVLWNASDNLVWIHNCFHFFKTGIFRAGSVWRVNQCASSHLCDSFDGLLLNASTARGNFCGIRLEVSLYYVCHRIFSLVMLLYVQRITCGNLWIRMLKTFFVKASDRPNLLFLWVQIRIGWCWCKDQCGWIWRILRNDLVRISLLADFRFQICVLLMVHYFLNSFVAFYWAEFSYQGVIRFSSVQSVSETLPFKQGQSPTDTAGVTEVARQPRSSEAKFEVRTVSNI